MRRNSLIRLAVVFLTATLLLIVSIVVLAKGTYMTTTDNENNNYTGTADGDMDVYLYDDDPLVPIEFNITVPETPATSAHLSIYAYDVDEESGEIDYVYLNGHQVGHLQGTNDTWNTTVFEVPTGWVISGTNTVSITIATSWAVEIDWGQILVDGGGAEKADMLDLTIDDYSLTGGMVDVQTSAIVSVTQAGNYRIEVSLVDPSQYMLNSDTDTFSAAAGDITTRTITSIYALSSGSGVYKIVANLFDDDTDMLQVTRYVTFTHTQGAGPEAVDADLTISKDYDVTFLTDIAYVIVASNLGPNAADGAVVSDTFSAQVTGVTWTCSGSGGATCTASGSGDINDTLAAFPSGGVVTYTVQGTLTNWTYMENTASVAAPFRVADPDTNNNSATVYRYSVLLPHVWKNFARP